MPFDRKQLAARRWRQVKVTVENDGDYLIRALSDAEVTAIQEKSTACGKGSFLPIALAVCLVDEAGKQLFKVEEWEEVRRLIPFGSLESLWDAVADLNGLKKKTPAELGTDLKNSPATQT